MSLPASITHYLASRARTVLQKESLQGEGGKTATKVLRQLRTLAQQSRLQLTAEEAIDLALIFPSNAREIISKGSVIKVQTLQDAALMLSDVFSLKAKVREDILSLRIRTACLECLLFSSPSQVLDALGEKSAFINEILTCYDALNTASKVLGGGKWNLKDPDPEPWKTNLLKAKLSILSVINILLNNYMTGGKSRVDRVVEWCFKLSEGVRSSNSISLTPFVNRNLIGDYENMYHVTHSLGQLSRLSDDPRLDVIIELIETSPGRDDHTPGGLQLLSTPAVSQTFRASPSAESNTHRKGKGRAAPEPEEDPVLASQIQEIQSILPEIDPQMIRQCLLDSRYAGNISRAMEALLDGYLPPDTPNVFDGMETTAPVRVENAFIKDRTNIFDDTELDVSSLRIGKQNAPTAEIDRATKLEILRRVAEMSSESETNESDSEDLDIEHRVAVEPKVMDGEQSADEESDFKVEHESALASKDVENILEFAYLRDQTLFERDANTRRGSGREELRKATGWTDEQIEGWRIMLERNPRKDKILQKHEFTGNRPFPPSNSLSGKQSSKSDSGGGAHRRGGGGRGGMGGSNSSGGTHSHPPSQDREQRAHNERQKSRQANHNRKRGHDKKMARGGMPV